MISITSIISPEISHAIFQALLHSLWQIPFIALGIKLLYSLNLSQTSKRSYHANLAAIILSMIVSGFTFFYYLFQGIGVLDSKINSASIESVNNFHPIITLSEAPSNTISWIDWLANYDMYVVLIWSVGVLLFFIRLITGWVGIQHIKKDLNYDIPKSLLNTFQSITHKLQIKKPVRIALSSNVTIPMILGYIKPVILIPCATLNHLTTDEVEAILIHELHHLLHNDFLKNLIVMIGETIFFYHPVIWLLSSEIKEERENLCDDAVVKYFPDRLKYAKTLVKLGEIYIGQNNNLTLALFYNKFKLMKRVKRILNLQNKDVFGKSKFVMIAALMSCFIIFSSAGIIQNRSQTAVINIPEYFDSQIQYTEITPLAMGHKNKLYNYEIQSDLPLLTDYSKYAPAKSFPQEDYYLSLNPTIKKNQVIPAVDLTIPPLMTESKFNIISTLTDTLDPKEKEEIMEKMRIKREELREKAREQRDKVRENREKIREEYKEELDRKRAELQELREKLGEERHTLHRDSDGNWTNQEIEELSREMSEWGQRFGEQFAEKIDGEYLKEITQWGKKFGKEFGDKFDHEFGDEFDNEWTKSLEHLGKQIEETFTEEWLEDIANLGDEIGTAVKEAMEEMDIEDSKYSYNYKFRDKNNKFTHDNQGTEKMLKVRLAERLNKDNLLEDKINNIIITDDKMTVNGKEQSAETLGAYKELIKRNSKGTFIEGKTKVKFRIEGKLLEKSSKTGITVDIEGL